MRRSVTVLVISATIALTGTIRPAEAKYASMVVDADTGEVLNASHVDDRNYPASLTKMMTLYLLFDALDRGQIHLSDQMPVSAYAAEQSPSKLGLRPGQTIKVEDAILAACTKSANDAAVTIAEFLGGSERGFAVMMTKKAHELGMRQTTFQNASGLPRPGQNISYARDMATLARALIHNHAKQYRYFATQEFTFNGEEMHNHNHMLEWYDGVDGIKTGYIAASGFNLVASAKRDGRRLIGVVFGGQSAAARDKHMAQLLDAAFSRQPGGGQGQSASLAEPAADTDTAMDERKAESVTADNGTAKQTLAKPAVKATQLAAAAPGVKKARRTEPKEDAAGDTDEDNWSIQVGAYVKKTQAHHAATAAMQKLGKLVADSEISIARGKGRHAVYRARLTGLDEETAREACRRLAKSHTSCSVLNPA